MGIRFTQAVCLLAALLSCLWLNPCEGTPVSATRIPAETRHVRDTRLIPNDKFKPLTPGTAAQQTPQGSSSVSNHAPVVYNVTNLDQSSTAEVQNSQQSARPRNFQPVPIDYDYDESAAEPAQTGFFRNPYAGVPQSGFPRYPTSFNTRYPTPSRHYMSSYDSGSPIGAGSSFGGSRRIESSHTMPLMSDDFGYQGNFGPSRSSNMFPYPTGDLGGGSSNNFYRSESYSYSSDGMGAPRIEQNVFDSRQGFGASSKHF